MTKDALKQYVLLRNALQSERVRIAVRLNDVNSALGIVEGSRTVFARTPASAMLAKRGLKVTSAEAHAKIAAAQRRRGAKYRAQQGE